MQEHGFAGLNSDFKPWKIFSEVYVAAENLLALREAESFVQKYLYAISPDLSLHGSI